MPKPKVLYHSGFTQNMISPIEPEKKVTLERLLSKRGIASRTQATKWIRDGRVKVNGKVCMDPDCWVDFESTELEIDNELKNTAEKVLYVFHKPRGVVTTHQDEKNRPTVFSLLPAEMPHLIAVGRLDWATSGLLLLTNDTELSAWLTDPIHQIPRTYIVTARGKVTEENLNTFKSGVRDQGELLKAQDVVLRKVSQKESHLIVTLTEGKNREIRRLFESIQHPVTKLKRVQFGPFALGDLQPGKFREPLPEEVQVLLKTNPAWDFINKSKSL